MIWGDILRYYVFGSLKPIDKEIIIMTLGSTQKSRSIFSKKHCIEIEKSHVNFIAAFDILNVNSLYYSKKKKEKSKHWGLG